MFPLQHSNQERVPLWNLETLEMTCWPQMNIANWLVLSVTLMMWSGIANKISWRRANQQQQQKKVVIRTSWEKHPQKKKSQVLPPRQLVSVDDPRLPTVAGESEP